MAPDVRPLAYILPQRIYTQSSLRASGERDIRGGIFSAASRNYPSRASIHFILSSKRINNYMRRCGLYMGCRGQPDRDVDADVKTAVLRQLGRVR